MSNALEKVAARALQEPAVEKAMSWESMLDSYDPQSLSEDDAASLVDAMKMIQLATRHLEDEKRRLTAPFNLGIAQIRDKFQPALDRLKALRAKADDILRAAKRAAEQRLRLEQAEAEKRAREAAAKAKAADDVDRPPMKTPLASLPSHRMARSNIVRGRSGDVVGRRDVKFEVTDMATFAAAYPHAVKAIEATVKLEIRAARERDPDAKLPGLEWWYEDGFNIR